MLLAHIYHPVGVGAVPTIVERTPYGRTNLNAGMAWYLSRAGPDGAYGSFLAYSDLIADGRASDSGGVGSPLMSCRRRSPGCRRTIGEVAVAPARPIRAPARLEHVTPSSRAPAGPTEGRGRTAPAWTRGCCPPAGAVAPNSSRTRPGEPAAREPRRMRPAFATGITGV